MRHIAHYPGQHTHPLLAKTATGEMSAADLTLDGEWGFLVEVAEDLGGTIHPFDKYQGPYIMYKGNKFWFGSDGQEDYIYNETTGEFRPFSVWQNPGYAANEIREMVGERYASRKQSRKTARRSLMWEVAVIDDLNHQEVAIWRQPNQTWQLYVDRQNPDEDVVDWSVVRSGPREEYEYITEVDTDAVFIDGGQESDIQGAKTAAEESLFSRTGSRKTAADRNHFVVNAEFNIYADSEEKADWVWRDFVFHALSSRQGNPNEHVTIETYSVDKGRYYRANIRSDEG
jgi:hypothetical protein